MLRVVDDVYDGTGNVRYEFNDGSSVTCKEIHSTRPPSLDRVSGEFTKAQCEAVVAYGRLKINNNEVSQ